ncbi:hypothetical protein ACFL1H_08360 [Nanoarchaeota archaeon]
MAKMRTAEEIARDFQYGLLYTDGNDICYYDFEDKESYDVYHNDGLIIKMIDYKDDIYINSHSGEKTIFGNKTLKSGDNFFIYKNQLYSHNNVKIFKLEEELFSLENGKIKCIKSYKDKLFGMVHIEDEPVSICSIDLEKQKLENIIYSCKWNPHMFQYFDVIDEKTFISTLYERMLDINNEYVKGSIRGSNYGNLNIINNINNKLFIVYSHWHKGIFSAIVDLKEKELEEENFIVKPKAQIYGAIHINDIHMRNKILKYCEEKHG